MGMAAVPCDAMQSNGAGTQQPLGTGVITSLAAGVTNWVAGSAAVLLPTEGGSHAAASPLHEPDRHPNNKSMPEELGDSAEC